MIFFVMFFLSTLNTTRLEENVNEHNPSIINLKNRKHLDETMDMNQKDDQSIKNQYGISQNIDKNIELFDYYQNINQNELLLNMESTNNEEKEINHNENNSTNDNISNSLWDIYNNQNYENLETSYYENQFIRDIEESLANAYIWDPEIHYEQNFMPSEVNYNVRADSSLTYDDKMIQEYSGDDHALLQANQNETTISRNISSGRQIEDQSTYWTINPKIENETKKKLHVTSSKTSDNQQKTIPGINTQRYHCIDDSNLTEIPDLIAYKECLENLSIQNNFISSITENIAGFTCLKKLNLSHNRINKIDCNIKNTNLEWLDLSYNRLKYKNVKCIFAMTTLKHLNLENNDIELIRKINSQELIILNMKNNCISSIPESIAGFTCLKKLNLSHNRINNINYKIKNTNLEWFDLSYNNLTYAICKCIFLMTTLKYLNLENNLISRIRRFNSTGLIILNLSINPITEIWDSFYKLPNIRQLFMSNLNTKEPICFSKILSNLKVLDISHNQFNFSLYNIEVLYLLDEVNLSNCGLTSFPISSEMINIRKLILLNNNLQALPIDFGKLRNNIEILDLRENPLIIFSTEDSLGALDILACYYGKVLMDEYIIQNIQELTFDEIYSKKYKKEWICLKQLQKNHINDEFCQNIARVIEYIGGEEIKTRMVEVITLVKEIRDSGFIDFEKTIEEVIKIIKENQYENICIKNIFDYLNTKFSSKFYKFLDDILSSYKMQCLKSTLNHIYNSDEHLNYWVYHLSDILSFIGIVKVKKNSKIHNDRNIILTRFINIMDLNALVNIIELELEKDEEMMGIFNILLGNDQEQSRKRLMDGTLKKETTVEKNCVKYILKIYQIID